MGKLVTKERMNALKEKKKNFDESRGRLPDLGAGVYVMVLTEAKAHESGQNSKSPGRKMVHLIYQDAAKKYGEVSEYLAVDGEEEWVDLHLQKLITRAEHLGLPELVDIDSQDSVVQYFGKGVGKKIQLAIGVAPRIWEKMNDNVPDWRIQYRPEIAYSGSLKEDLASGFDVAKNTKALPAAEQARWDRVMGGNGSPDPTAEADITDIDEELQDAPEPEPTPKPTAKKAAPKTKAPEPEVADETAEAKNEIDFDNLADLEL